MIVSTYEFSRAVAGLTEEPLYSSNSLESSSISVYATLMCDRGRSNDDRAVRAEEKKDCVFLLSNISTPGSSGVMGVMACWKRVRSELSIGKRLQLTMITELLRTHAVVREGAAQGWSINSVSRAWHARGSSTTGETEKGPFGWTALARFCRECLSAVDGGGLGVDNITSCCCRDSTLCCLIVQ